MTYPYYRRPPGASSQRSSENWIKPPYHRGPVKRRCSSPSFFPRKVHISEEKVAEQLENLCIGKQQKHTVSTAGSNGHKPEFLLDGSNRAMTFQEIEDSIEIDGVDFQDNNLGKGTVELAPELLSEIKKLNRRILSASNFRLSTKRMPSNPCQELVLWKPPSGSIIEVLKAVKEATDESANTEDDYYHKDSSLRLDRIEEEVRQEVEDFTMTDSTSRLQQSLTKSPGYLMDRHPQRENNEQFDESLMDLAMDL